MKEQIAEFWRTFSANDTCVGMEDMDISNVVFKDDTRIRNQLKIQSSNIWQQYKGINGTSHGIKEYLSILQQMVS